MGEPTLGSQISSHLLNTKIVAPPCANSAIGRSHFPSCLAVRPRRLFPFPYSPSTIQPAELSGCDSEPAHLFITLRLPLNFVFTIFVHCCPQGARGAINILHVLLASSQAAADRPA